ncbi:peptide-methionine (R)-S-oxide reductase [Pseudidiomarina gelatinasegens]|jgi:methionine-R-sulfoxide reductase|uniref:peptide-methionine (R)-S-oxide reductase n=1 Tax=Pseudidiomarina gelatinasegens TaxID=2487740 RepID=A0A443Z5Q4_9GAMM|nr:peptide-methionine (R)-S-oxide reductase MsrB [Pseudidiomarina gelatinasegens]RWU12093.1 peptide-methionine (R)-S-oxide reductase [Pseudidiomarina gelatinasegens]
MARPPFKKPSAAELKQRLSDMQYYVTQQDGTEPPFQNAYWNEQRRGIYVDIVSGEPLYSSNDKFDSSCGWPSFTRTISDDVVATKNDLKFGMVRTEIRSAQADSHLGHVFDDGPLPLGTRHCVNSAAVEFIPLEEMEARGYGDWIAHIK